MLFPEERETIPYMRVTLNDLVFKAVGSDLHIYIGEEQNQGIIIKSHLGSPDMSHIEFADGSSFDLKNQGLKHTKGICIAIPFPFCNFSVKFYPTAHYKLPDG